MLLHGGHDRALCLCLLISVLAPAAHAQQFGPAQFPIRADDGDLLTNHSLTAEQVAKLGQLPGSVNVGNPKGNVTLNQFYDLNCPFCREAAQDMDELVRTDRALSLVFVPYPTLSVQSVEGARVELAVRELAAQRFLEFHRKDLRRPRHDQRRAGVGGDAADGAGSGEDHRGRQCAARDGNHEGACDSWHVDEDHRHAGLYHPGRRDPRPPGLEPLRKLVASGAELSEGDLLAAPPMTFRSK